ncbi:predicted protein [Histoplasma mississippiense (nom. inval.)]|nr:predicted protein [Histoplasma mississippiense (nom. inval.)]EDN03036.1 predicted protein [Histoplasma mississippiense (nom. inval.)]
MKQYGILPMNCYNMDEIEFQEGQKCAEVYIHRWRDSSTLCDLVR